MFGHAVATETKDWYAWIESMPSKPDNFHVAGEIYVANPGIEAHLSVREHQGTNPNIMLLDLHLDQKPGGWIQVMTWNRAWFDKALTPDNLRYKQVEIFLDNKSILKIPVGEVH